MEPDEIRQLVAEAVKKETEALRNEVSSLKAENIKLWNMVTRMDRDMDTIEQYNRKSSLILGGAFPEGEEFEAPSKTRETALQVIQEKLGVEIKGGIAACHRLKNKKRVIVKFNDMDDRDAVYQAKFTQEGEWPNKIAVHENLTEKRSNMVTKLEEMRKTKKVLNYHTKNGNILARAYKDRKYVRVEPWFTENEIITAMENADLRPVGADNTNTFMRSQTFKQIPRGNVAYQAANLEGFVVSSSRRTRKNASKKAPEDQAQETEVKVIG